MCDPNYIAALKNWSYPDDYSWSFGDPPRIPDEYWFSYFCNDTITNPWPEAYITRFTKSDVSYLDQGGVGCSYSAYEPTADFYIPREGHGEGLTLGEIDETIKSVEQKIKDGVTGNPYIDEQIASLAAVYRNKLNNFLLKNKLLFEDGTFLYKDNFVFSKKTLTLDRVLQDTLADDLKSDSLSVKEKLRKFQIYIVSALALDFFGCDAYVVNLPEIMLRAGLVRSTSLDVSFAQTGHQKYETLLKMKLIGWVGAYLNHTEVRAGCGGGWWPFSSHINGHIRGYAIIPFEFEVTVGYQMSYEIRDDRFVASFKTIFAPYTDNAPVAKTEFQENSLNLMLLNNSTVFTSKFPNNWEELLNKGLIKYSETNPNRVRFDDSIKDWEQLEHRLELEGIEKEPVLLIWRQLHEEIVENVYNDPDNVRFSYFILDDDYLASRLEQVGISESEREPILNLWRQTYNRPTAQ